MKLERKEIGKLLDRYMEGADLYDEMMYITPYEKLSEEKQQVYDKFLSQCEKAKFIFDETVNPMAHLEGQDYFCHALSKLSDEEPIAHRLYFNYDIEDRVEFARKFILTCGRLGMPFYIKWYKLENRADNLVVYATDKRLEQTCKVIESIVSENPALMAHKNLPMPIDKFGWFGYGVETPDIAGVTSYNGEVARTLTTAFVYGLNENRNLLTPKKDADLSTFGKTLYELSRKEREKEMAGAKSHKNAKILDEKTQAYFKDFFEKHGQGILNRMLSNGFGGDIDGPANSTRDIVDNDNIFSVRMPNSYTQMVVTPLMAARALNKYFEFKNPTLGRAKVVSDSMKMFNRLLDQKGLNFETPKAVENLAKVTPSSAPKNRLFWERLRDDVEMSRK